MRVMQNKFPLWKNVLLLLITVFAFIYALPNIYPEDPAIHITLAERGVLIDNALQAKIGKALGLAKIDVKGVSQELDDLLIRFRNTDDQLKALDRIKATIGQDYTVALNLAPATPAWLVKLAAQPMKQGLDLRGGVHFLLEVDIKSVLARRLDGIVKTITQEMRQQRIRYTKIVPSGDNQVTMYFRNAEVRDRAYRDVHAKFPYLLLHSDLKNGRFILHATISPKELNNIRQYTLEQTMGILRNRINELGVGEAVVQQQGAHRVAVDLPGVQDSARAKQILGGTATLEFRLVDEKADPNKPPPPTSQLYHYRENPILLQRQVILSGESITSAMSNYDQQSASPSVSIQLGGGGESLFNQTTRTNIGKAMAIVYVESKIHSRLVNDEVVHSSEKVERIISVATIQSALGNHFQITGLQGMQEARDLALLLRAGALPAAIYPIEERTVGPSLGKENIQRGLVSLMVGMGVILLLMIIYYRLFGLIANIALLLNLVFLTAILSIIDATLTLPGIAGIVLTIGMAVDANVLIYERIREELRQGVSPQAAIYAGYERAFATIVDANVTTLIVGLILFAVGTGPIRGFAVTLSVGLLTSMLTGVTFTRAIVNVIYGNRSVKKLSIGIS